MVSDPGHSRLHSKAIFLSSYKFLWLYRSVVSLGNAAQFDLMASDISLALLIRWVKCQVELYQRVQQSPRGKDLEPCNTAAGFAF